MEPAPPDAPFGYPRTWRIGYTRGSFSVLRARITSRLTQLGYN
jgi:hypothetical protein